MYSLVLALHIAGGAIALVTYWMAALARKGGAWHRHSGRVYLLAMAGVLLSSPPLAIVQIRNGRESFGLFLLFLLLLTATTCLCAWRAIRDRGNPARYYGSWYRRLGLANVSAGLGILAVGLLWSQPVLAGFALIGVGRGGHMLYSAARPPAPRWWLFEHYGSQIGNGIATHVAFLSIGLARLLPEGWQAVVTPVAWFGPAVVGAVAAIWISRRYGRPRPVTLSSPPATAPLSR